MLGWLFFVGLTLAMAWAIRRATAPEQHCVACGRTIPTPWWDPIGPPPLHDQHKTPCMDQKG